MRGHRLWSYDGAGTTGYANPEGKDAQCDSIETLLLAAREAAVPQTPREHVRWLAESQQIVSRFPADWIGDLVPGRQS